jgi:hypothetical protein
MIRRARRCTPASGFSENGQLTLYYAYDFTEVEKTMHRQVRRRRSSLLTWHRVGLG